MRRHLALYLPICVVLAASPSGPQAATPTFTTIDPPGSVLTLAVGINDAGEIVGRFTDSAGVTHGFLLAQGTYNSFDAPGATGWTRAFGINSAGAIVGDYMVGQQEHAFLLSNGGFATIDPPGAHGAIAEGINATGDVVGTYFADQNFNGGGSGHGFLLRAGVFTTIDFPGASYTEAWRITDDGQIVGRYHTGDGKFHIYLLTNGGFTSIPDLSGAVQTATLEVGGFNASGDISATYCSSTPCPWGIGGMIKTSGNVHGLLLSSGQYTTFDFPSATVTLALGLNSAADIVGCYIDPSGGIHGYLRTP